MRILRLFTYLMMATLLAACDASDLAAIFPAPDSAAAVEETIVNEEMVAHGVEVYRSQYCGICHTLDAANTRGTFGPEHNGIASVIEQRLADGTYTGDAQTVEEYLYEALLQPREYIVPTYEITSHPMPAYTHLPEEDIDAMVYMLAHQRQ